MFNVEEYIQELITAMQGVFGSRLLYVGLQGSYLRQEATENSDIDIMVIVDKLSVQDLDSYRNIISQMEQYDKSCGFICGKDEFANWNLLEMCHLVHTTKDYYGRLSELIPEYREEDILHYIKISLGNLYHEICHRYVHSDKMKNYQRLPITYKGVFFILQNMYYLKTGVFCSTKKELLSILEGADKEIMEMSLCLAADEEYDFDTAFTKLFCWCQSALTGLHRKEQG